MLASLLPHMTGAAGVRRRLPDGNASYAAVLKLHTTTNLTPGEIHRTGLEQVADLKARIATLLPKQGFRTGSVRERLVELGRAPGKILANDDAGHAALLGYVNGRAAAIRLRVPQAFSRLRVRAQKFAVFQAGASGDRCSPGHSMARVPGIFWINLRDTGDWPRHSLPTLVYP
jgi:uncharacterized protein (DUF885 family)